MPSKIRIEFNSSGFHEILCSPECEQLVRSQAERIAGNAGDGFEARTYVGNYGGGRVIGSVWPTCIEAEIAEATDKVLSKAVHS